LSENVCLDTKLLIDHEPDVDPCASVVGPVFELGVCPLCRDQFIVSEWDCFQWQRLDWKVQTSAEIQSIMCNDWKTNDGVQWFFHNDLQTQVCICFIL